MTNHLSVIQFVRAQVEQYQRVAWFLIEWAEREHRVTLRSFAAWTPPRPVAQPVQARDGAKQQPARSAAPAAPTAARLTGRGQRVL